MAGLGRSLAREPAARAGADRAVAAGERRTQAGRSTRCSGSTARSPRPIPACMAAKAAGEQADDRGYRYLRRLREGHDVRAPAAGSLEALVEESRAAGLDVERFRIDLRSNAITETFATDLDATEALVERLTGPVRARLTGAGGAPLPTLVFGAEDGAGAWCAGFGPSTTAGRRRRQRVPCRGVPPRLASRRRSHASAGSRRARSSSLRAARAARGRRAVPPRRAVAGCARCDG